MNKRADLIRSPFTKSSRLIEIGASHSPIVPKLGGWKTTVVDHACREELAQKYRKTGAIVDRIEAVDIVWRDGDLSDAFPIDQHGQYDGLIASHVGEHLPDLIGFFKAADKLLAPGGTIALALPDKRVCFDFFRPLTTSGDLLEAHSEKRARHLPRIRFNEAAYSVFSDGQAGWMRNSHPSLSFANTLDDAYREYNEIVFGPRSAPAYVDAHAWAFTPASFELLVLELNHLGVVTWWPSSFETPPGVEFYVWLSRKRPLFDTQTLSSRRMQLLKRTVIETEEQITQLEDRQGVVLEEPAEPAPERQAARVKQPSVAAVVPLYNGGRYIEGALRSVFAQTLLPTEVIVVNDGSTDDGSQIVESLSKELPITLLHRPNGGQSSARNYGVAHATAEAIAFLDQDDLWYPTHLQELIEPFLRAHQPKLGWVYSNLDEIDGYGNMICYRFLTTLPVPHPKQHIFHCLDCDMFILPSASLILRSAFDKIGGFDERLSGYEDDDLFLRLFRSGYNNVFIDRALSQWRIHPSSSSYTYRMGRSRMIYARKLFEQFPDDGPRRRYYSRDHLAPRFLVGSLEEYKSALQIGDEDLIRQAWRDIEYVIGFLGPKQRRRIGATLKLLRSPRVARRIFAMRPRLRPLMLYAFR